MASDRPTIAGVMGDPGVSFALKAVLLAWSDRDVVDAANDAELLSAILGAEADRFAGRSS